MDATTNPKPRITKKERVVLDHLSRCLSNKMIAHELGIMEATVKVHIRHLFKKFGAANRMHLVARAYKYGFFEEPRSLGSMMTGLRELLHEIHDVDLKSAGTDLTPEEVRLTLQLLYSVQGDLQQLHKRHLSTEAESKQLAFTLM